MWILSYIKVLKYTNLNCYIIIILFVILNAVIFLKKREKLDINKNTISNILITEILFLISLIIWVYICGFTPKITPTGERFMDYGYIESIMNQEYMPPKDMWLSGESVNYYYFGQYLISFLCKISQTSASLGYHLMLATVGAFSFVLPYCIGYNLGKNLSEKSVRVKIKKYLPTVIAVLTGLSISIGGTLHYPIYKYIINDDDSYYYWEVSRYITSDEDKTATDILPYATITGELHAHLIDTIFVFTTLALLLQLLLREENKKYFNLNLVMLGFTLGIQKMTNYWDFPIYLVVISAIIVAYGLKSKKINKKNIGILLLEILGVVLIEELITLPFTLNLHISATEVYFTGVSSPLYKLAVLWGGPTLLIAIFVITLIIRFIKEKEKGKLLESLENYIKSLTPSQIYVGVIGLCAIGLIIIPEIIYLKDIYGAEFRRFNTVFKLVFQARILFCMCTSYILADFLKNGETAKKVIGVIGTILLILTLPYGIDATQYVTRDLFNKNIRRGITHSLDYVEEELPDDLDGINWIKENISRDKVILQKPSGSYDKSTRISVFTGNPTVIGWYNHEWMWRTDSNYGMPEEVKKRIEEIEELYTGKDTKRAKEIINNYGIDYIYIGNVEIKEYKNLNTNLLKSLGKVVYEKKNYDLTPVYIIKARNE